MQSYYYRNGIATDLYTPTDNLFSDGTTYNIETFQSREPGPQNRKERRVAAAKARKRKNRRHK